MPVASTTTVVLPSRRDAVVRRIALEWRRLTSPARARRAGKGEPTLIACSGGADSSALVLALAAVSDDVVVGHVVHDLRPRAEALADRDAVRALAEGLGLKFVEREVHVRRAGENAEGAARRLRYEALAEMARECGVKFIATAHHAHDQSESVLMHLVRGAGPAGLGGIAPKRRMDAGSSRSWLIRPMLGVTPEKARDLCRGCGWTWREDATNEDTSRLRAAIRHEVLPRLLAIRQSAVERIADAAALQRELARMLRRTAQRRIGTELVWPRAELRRMSSPVLGEVLRQAFAGMNVGRGLDRLPARSIGAAVRLIRSADTEPRELDWSGSVVEITSRRVKVRQASKPDSTS
ncbi:MAG: tRNA lysidine(34) synthetase TilS [Phycisphaerales bacterium]